MRAALLETYLFEYVRHRISDGRCRRERQVHYPELRIQSGRRFGTDQLAYPRDLERRLLDSLSHLVKRRVIRHPRENGSHDSRARDSYAQHAVGFSHTVEGARHERVVFYCIAEHYKLCSSYALRIGRHLGGFPDLPTHELHSVHIDAGLRRAYVYRRTHESGLSKCARNGIDQLSVAGAEALLDKSRITSDKVDAYLVSGAVERLCIKHRVSAGDACEHRDRSHAHSLIDDRYAVLVAYGIRGLHQTAGEAADLVVYLRARPVYVRIGAVQQRYPHSGRSYIQIIVSDHGDGLHDVVCIEHVFIPFGI